MCDQETLDREFNQKLPDLEWNICYFSVHEKAIYNAWIEKLKNANSSMDEKILRNDVLHYLIERTTAGLNLQILPPFTEVPKEQPLTDPIWKFPLNMKTHCPKAAHIDHLLEMFRASPDRGAFLAEQPVPRTGTFGFMVFKKSPK